MSLIAGLDPPVLVSISRLELSYQQKHRTGTGLWLTTDDGYSIAVSRGWQLIPSHRALDIAMAVGTPVRAMHGGRVVSASYAGDCGNMVRIERGNLRSKFCHLSQMVVGVGDVVRQGQVVAYSGNTGNSDGPHLHVEVSVNDVLKDPLEAIRMSHLSANLLGTGLVAGAAVLLYAAVN